ncbi:reverse transcriptase [Phytophthora megakarya]|uniref:Reverse transcriptase n=1 Tax=Phytophthora megakarya TaxID=4795 RepID=A0A225UV95_9STRA|nr:reverse transcriptase [Phytophthora megakarya]
MLRTLSPTEEHGVALGFILSEQREVAAAITVSPEVTPRKEYLKLHVSNYEGKEDTSANSTLNVLTRACTGYQYKKMELESPPTDTSELISLPVMCWKRFAKDLYDGRIEQLCILSDCKRMTSEAEELRQLFVGSATESDDTLSGKTKQERFDEQSCKIRREHKDVLSDETPAEEVRDGFALNCFYMIFVHSRAVDEKKTCAWKWTAAWSQRLDAAKLG